MDDIHMMAPASGFQTFYFLLTLLVPALKIPRNITISINLKKVWWESQKERDH
jgi:hypothetical protein